MSETARKRVTSGATIQFQKRLIEQVNSSTENFELLEKPIKLYSTHAKFVVNYVLKIINMSIDVVGSYSSFVF